jgi:hypothetical protein
MFTKDRAVAIGKEEKEEAEIGTYDNKMEQIT